MNLFENTDPEIIKNEIIKLIGLEWFKLLDFNVCVELYEILTEIKQYENKGNKCYPNHYDCLKSMKLIKPDNVKVIIISKVTYPNENATGVPFACANEYSKSLTQICYSLEKYDCTDHDPYVEDDFHEKYPMNLDHWINSGVLLLNRKHRALENKPDSFDNYNWNAFIEDIIKKIITQKNKDCIVLTWGNDGKKIITSLTNKYKRFKFYHLHFEHPVSASRNKRYWVCDHFKEVNIQLKSLNQKPIQWFL
jgi:uracil DNA glycosylase